MKRLLNLALIVCASISMHAAAGTACSDKPQTPQTVRSALELALKTKTTLDESGAQVALIARVGVDLSKYNLRYSHVGFVWRDHPEGRWLLIHELNQCGTASSALFNEGLGDFFLDDLFAYETEIMIPSAAIQERIVSLLSTGRAFSLHDEHYNMVAFPFSTQYQNSNQWALETLASALSIENPIRTREQAQAWLKLSGYAPTTLEIPTLTRLGARMFRANVAFDDHPMDRRMAGHIDTVTVESVERFLRSRDPQMRDLILSFP
jgi:hypothetical protein